MGILIYMIDNICDNLPKWDLKDLYQSIDDQTIIDDIYAVRQRAKDFQQKYKGQLGDLSAVELLEAIKSYEQITELGVKPIIYAILLHAADSLHPQYGASLAKFQEEYTQTSEYLVFWGLELANLSPEKMSTYLQAPELISYHHYIQEITKYQSHQLSESEEILWQNLDLVGSSAWTRLFDEVIAKIEFKIQLPEHAEEQIMTEEEILSLLYHENRMIRQLAAQSLTQGLKGSLHILNYIYNIVLQEHAISDRIRLYDHAKHSRNLSNEISDKAVDNLLLSAEKYNSLVRRFYKLKQQLLGYNELYDYDRYAPIPQESSSHWDWDKACDLVYSAYHEFSPIAGDIVQLFYTKNWIDVGVRPGKRGGAFSAGTIPSVHPYILLNYTYNNRDVATLAHELGHGIHQYLSREVGFLNADTPLTTAETASVFGEMLTFDKLLSQISNPKEQLALIMNKLDDIIATVFRQVCMTRFEEMAHIARREEGELSTERMNDLWISANKDMFQDSIIWTDNYQSWWSYIPHFVHTPFYCYAYAFGLLLSITLYGQYKYTDNKKEFAEKYLQVLSSGGSIDPISLMKIMDIDLEDDQFWDHGFSLIDEMITRAESLAI